METSIHIRKPFLWPFSRWTWVTQLYPWVFVFLHKLWALDHISQDPLTPFHHVFLRRLLWVIPSISVVLRCWSIFIYQNNSENVTEWPAKLNVTHTEFSYFWQSTKKNMKTITMKFICHRGSKQYNAHNTTENIITYNNSNIQCYNPQCYLNCCSRLSPSLMVLTNASIVASRCCPNCVIIVSQSAIVSAISELFSSCFSSSNHRFSWITKTSTMQQQN